MSKRSYTVKKENPGWFKKGEQGSTKGQFKKNHAPWNKGVKGSVKPNSGSFGTGHEPWNKDSQYRQIQWDKHPLFKTGEKRYRQHLMRLGRSSECEGCGFSDDFGKKTHVHHKDRNRENNELENLQVLCTTCHANEHKNWEKRLWRPTRNSVA